MSRPYLNLNNVTPTGAKVYCFKDSDNSTTEIDSTTESSASKSFTNELYGWFWNVTNIEHYGPASGFSGSSGDSGYSSAFASYAMNAWKNNYIGSWAVFYGVSGYSGTSGQGPNATSGFSHTFYTEPDGTSPYVVKFISADGINWDNKGVGDVFAMSGISEVSYNSIIGVSGIPNNALPWIVLDKKYLSAQAGLGNVIIFR